MLSAGWKMTAAKGAVAIAMQKLVEEHEGAAFEQLEVYSSGKGVCVCVRTVADIPRGELQLVPATMRVDHKIAEGAFGVCTFECGDDVVELYIYKHIVMPLNKDGEENKNPWVSHFWLVQKFEDKRECNVELQWVHEDVGDFKISIPTIVNKRALKKGVVLKCLHKDQTSKEKDKGKEKETGSAAPAAPKKRQRR